jgi:hypothetical protein
MGHTLSRARPVNEVAALRVARSLFMSYSPATAAMASVQPRSRQPYSRRFRGTRTTVRCVEDSSHTRG